MEANRVELEILWSESPWSSAGTNNRDLKIIDEALNFQVISPWAGAKHHVQKPGPPRRLSEYLFGGYPLDDLHVVAEEFGGLSKAVNAVLAAKIHFSTSGWSDWLPLVLPSAPEARVRARGDDAGNIVVLELERVIQGQNSPYWFEYTWNAAGRIESFKGELPERLLEIPPSGMMTINNQPAALDKGVTLPWNAGGRLVSGHFRDLKLEDGIIKTVPEQIDITDKRTGVLLRSTRVGLPQASMEAETACDEWPILLHENEARLNAISEQLGSRPIELGTGDRAVVEELKRHFLAVARTAKMPGIALRAYHHVVRCDLMLGEEEKRIFDDCVAALECMASEAPGRLVLEAGHGFSTALMRFGRAEVALIHLRPWLADFALRRCDAATRMQFLADSMLQNRLWTGYSQSTLWLASGQLEDIREKFIVAGLGALLAWELSREPLLVPADQWVKLGFVPESWTSERHTYAVQAMHWAEQAFQLFAEMQLPDASVHSLYARLRHEKNAMEEWIRERERAR